MILWFLSILLVYVLPAYLVIGIVVATVQMAKDGVMDIRLFLRVAFGWGGIALWACGLWLLFWLTGADHSGYGDFYGDR